MERDSAVLGLPHEHQIALEGDHRNICKFADIESVRFRVVKSKLEEILPSLKWGLLSTENREHFFDSLRTSNYEEHRDRIDAAVPGTCTWIFEHPSYESWIASPDPTLLWISANAGCGKSVLASFLVDRLVEAAELTDTPTNICYFFFKSDNHQQMDAVHGMQALLHQVYRQQRELVESGTYIHDRHLKNELRHLWNAFVVAISQPEAHNTVCLIDGLDECEPKSRALLLSFISSFFKIQLGRQDKAQRDEDWRREQKMAGEGQGSGSADRTMRGAVRPEALATVGRQLDRISLAGGEGNVTSGMGDLKPKMKMIIVSRPETQIKVAFDVGLGTKATDVSRHSHPFEGRLLAPASERYLHSTSNESTLNEESATTLRNPCTMIRLMGEDEEEAISADVTRVVEAHIDTLVEHGFPMDILEDVKVELIERADRTFLWVSLILNLLKEKVEAGASPKELSHILRSRDIFAIYAELLASRPDSPRARKMLNIILAATRPLTVQELNIALAVPPDKATKFGMVTFDTIEYDISYPFDNHIKSLCGHFIRIIRNRVYLVHETAREFLLADDQFAEPAEDIGPHDWNWPQPVEYGSGFAYTESPMTSVPFQHSFTLAEAHSLVLDICSTYLYCLGRDSKCTKKGDASPKTAAFLTYAAQSWDGHLAMVRRSKRRLDWGYYENLVNPLFPGFTGWIGQSSLPQHPPGPATAVHDFYLNYLDLKVLRYDGGDERVEDDGCDGGASQQEGFNEFGEGNSRRSALLASQVEQAWGVAASNPTSIKENFFPHVVDTRGRVFFSPRYKHG